MPPHPSHTAVSLPASPLLLLQVLSPQMMPLHAILNGGFFFFFFFSPLRLLTC